MAPPNKLKLPKALADQLGLGPRETGHSQNRSSRPRLGRKDLRKAARAEKKAARTGPPPAKRTKVHHVPDPVPEGIASKPKPILKTTKKPDSSPIKRDLRSASLPPRFPKSPRNKLTEEDEEIAALEKKLGLKDKKKRLADAGFDDLLEGLEEEEDSDAQDHKKRKAEGDEWLDRKRTEARKRRGLLAKFEEDLDGEDDDGASDMSLDGLEFPDDESNDDADGPGTDGMVLDAEDDFEDFGSDDDDEDEEPSLPRVRENPYVAPVAPGEASQKYIPPSLRKPAASDSEALVSLRRAGQGILNRLSWGNFQTILSKTEELYQNNPRQHVTSVLVELLMTHICKPDAQPDTTMIVYSGFVAGLYKAIGVEFAAQVVEKVVELFDEHIPRSATEPAGSAAATSSRNKETTNILLFLSQLYIFGVIGGNLPYDYIQVCAGSLSELHVELLLKIVQTCGRQLRQDDPLALKNIVTMLGSAIASVGGMKKLSERTQFMIQTINDLKNNKMKTKGPASAATSEHIVRMKKTLGTLNARSIKAHEPLRIGLKDIKDSDQKGKWWLVGASWAGNIPSDNRPASRTSDGSRVTSMSHNHSVQMDDSPTSDLVQLAKEQGMNTDVRIAIFCAIMDSSNYKDAHLRLMNLRLKRVQQYEIPTVLVHCVGQEKSYNPYYALVAKRICDDKKLKTSFQFCLWDIFKKMGETGDDDDSKVIEDPNMDNRRIIHLAKMFGKLIGGGDLSLIVLRKLNLSSLQPKTKIFMEALFIRIFFESQRESESKRDEQSVVNILERVKETPQLITGLLYFLEEVVRKTGILEDKKEIATVKWACKIARDTLESYASGDT